MIKNVKTFFLLLNRKEKISFLLILFFSAVGAALEMLGIGLIIPIISSLNNQLMNGSYINNEILSIFSFFSISNDKFIFVLLVIFIFIFSLKTFFFTIFTFFNAKFSADLSSSVSKKIFNNYINQDYSFFLKKGSSTLIQNINIEISNFINVFLASLLVFLNEIIILFAISLILIYLSPLSFFLFISIIGFFSLFFVYILNKYLKRWGKQRQLHQLISLRQLQASIRNIKDLKIYNLENKFYKYFSSEINQLSKIDKYVNFLSVLPRYYVEFFGVICFFLIINIFLSFDYSNDQIIIILGVFSFSALKILPSINRIINSLIKIKYSQASLQIIYKEMNLHFLDKKIISNKKKITFVDKDIELEKVFFQYDGQNNYVLNNINIQIDFGKIIGVIGESGSGKTTLIDLILGLIKPTKGKILINGIDIFKDIRSWQSNIGYVQQFSYFIEDSIKNNIALGSKKYSLDFNKLNECLEITGLKKIIQKLPKKIETQITELGNNFSGGQRQRLSIARALYANPKILILDEATNSLDDKNEEKIIKNIIDFQKNKTVIIVTHKKQLHKYCDVVFEVNNGDIKKKK